MIAIGSQSVLCLLENGEVWGWGRKFFGEIGTGDYNPVKIFENCEYISMGYSHSAIITKNKELYMWGDHSYGQVSSGNYEINVKNVSLRGYSLAAVFVYYYIVNCYLSGCYLKEKIDII